MTKNRNIVAEEGIQFFGKICAAATHEIKNTLAIINESAGLLEDLTLISDKGSPLSVERICDISQRMTRQVQRADLVLKKLNRFSHSVDLSTEVADLEKTVYFVLDLGARLIEKQSAVIEVTPPVSPLLISTNLFFLENMIWKAIETASGSVEGKQKVKISFGHDCAIPSIWFSMETDRDDKLDTLFGSFEDKALIDHLGITIEINKNNSCFGLIWPCRF